MARTRGGFHKARAAAPREKEEAAEYSDLPALQSIVPASSTLDSEGPADHGAWEHPLPAQPAATASPQPGTGSQRSVFRLYVDSILPSTLAAAPAKLSSKGVCDLLTASWHALHSPPAGTPPPLPCVSGKGLYLRSTRQARAVGESGDWDSLTRAEKVHWGLRRSQRATYH